MKIKGVALLVVMGVALMLTFGGMSLFLMGLTGLVKKALPEATGLFMWGGGFVCMCIGLAAIILWKDDI